MQRLFISRVATSVVAALLSACALPETDQVDRPLANGLLAQLRLAETADNDSLVIVPPTQAGFDENLLAAGISSIRQGEYGNVHSVLIFRQGALASENYFAGEDWNNHQGYLGVVQHGRDTLHDVRSISKTVVALAVLLAHDQGYIDSLDRPLLGYFPEFAYIDTGGPKSAITIKHALTMTAGLDWDDKVYFGPSDTLDKVWNRNLVAAPGDIFAYNGGLTQLLAEVVKRTTGKDVHHFAMDQLFAPLGIKRSEWAVRSDGAPDADSGLRLRSRDLAKIGLLIANGGRWAGRQIIPANLVDQAITPHVNIPQDEEAHPGDALSYGYQVWLPSFQDGGKRVQLIELAGNGGQKIYIDQDEDLLLVITAGDYDRNDLPKSSFDIFFDIVRPALPRR